jgi:regulation of enolase protein 1 (concanavalin A-like superfamily)
MSELKAIGSLGVIDSRLSWMNEPDAWSLDASNKLRVTAAGGTNFWQRTRHRRRADNGHLLGAHMTGDFQMEVTVTTYPKERYDQAGLMARVDEDSWLKTSAEYEREGRALLGAVATNLGWSDWSCHVVPDLRHRLRVRRSQHDYFVDVAVGDEWVEIRAAHLTDGGAEVMAGIYACAPVGSGFTAVFEAFCLKTAAKKTRVRPGEAAGGGSHHDVTRDGPRVDTA